MSAPTPEELRAEFLLDPDVAYLNHGSFGACPAPVFERYQQWQRQLEREPVEFLGRRLPGLLDGARAELAAYVGADAEGLVFVENATTGVNVAARAIELEPGDEVLATELEYGACELAWERTCAWVGARYVRAPVPLPLHSPADVVDALFARVGERTRAVFTSHVTSNTGLVLPLEEIVARAHVAGLVTIVDGAHGPAHVPVDLAALGADFYTGNCHKWLGAPKGAGFLHVAAEWRERVDGPIVSWGYEPGKGLHERVEEQGTRDPAAFLTVPDAIRFQAERDWDAVRERCRALTREARERLCWLLGTEPLAPAEMLAQMATVRLPKPAPGLTERLFHEQRIEIPVTGPAADHIRISIAAYTTRAEVDRLLSALAG